VRSSAQVFDEPTLRAVARWKFEPGRKDGRAVRFRMSVPVVFNVHD
jgi:protein TonB